MVYLYALILFCLNALALSLVLVGLPGIWLMVIFSWGVSYLSGTSMISTTTLIVLAGLALASEVVELVAGSAGSKKAGGTWRGSAGALGGGLVGGIVGSFIIPVVGSILGACIGAFLGALGGELSGGKQLEAAIDVGRGAFIGRLLGTIYKLAFGVVILIVATVASVVP
jgi:uncharacterized protein